jgi:cell division protein FtsB
MKTESEIKNERRQLFYKLHFAPWVLLTAVLISAIVVLGYINYSIRHNYAENTHAREKIIASAINSGVLTESFNVFGDKSLIVNKDILDLREVYDNLVVTHNFSQFEIQELNKSMEALIAENDKLKTEINSATNNVAVPRIFNPQGDEELSRQDYLNLSRQYDIKFEEELIFRVKAILYRRTGNEKVVDELIAEIQESWKPIFDGFKEAKKGRLGWIFGK